MRKLIDYVREKKRKLKEEKVVENLSNSAEKIRIKELEPLSVTPEIKEKLDSIPYCCSSDYNVIKRKRPNLEKGDIFAINPFDDIYFYGVVLDSGLDIDYMGNNLVCICMLKRYTNGLNENLNLDRICKEDIWFGPKIITKSYWYNGWFYNIGKNIASGIELDYGFYSLLKRSYVDVLLNELDHVPDVANRHSISSNWAIQDYMFVNLVIDSSFLDDETVSKFNTFLDNWIKRVEKENEPVDVESLTGFDREIYPFTFAKAHSRRYEVMLTNFDDLKYLFEETLAEGGGYDWEALLKLYIKENYPDDRKRIKFDSEAEMFYMYSSNEELLKEILSRVCSEIKENKLSKYTSRIRFEEI